MATGDFVLGLNAKLYYNTATWATPTWVEITNAKDVTQTMEKETTDITTRGTGGFKQSAGTLKDVTLAFQLQMQVDDAAFDAINAAFFNNTQIDLWANSGGSTDTETEGIRAECDITRFTRTEPLTGALMYDVEAKPASLDNDPVWTAGA